LRLFVGKVRAMQFGPAQDAEPPQVIEANPQVR